MILPLRAIAALVPLLVVRVCASDSAQSPPQSLAENAVAALPASTEPSFDYVSLAAMTPDQVESIACAQCDEQMEFSSSSILSLPPDTIALTALYLEIRSCKILLFSLPYYILYNVLPFITDTRLAHHMFLAISRVFKYARLHFLVRIIPIYGELYAVGLQRCLPGSAPETTLFDFNCDKPDSPANNILKKLAVVFIQLYSLIGPANTVLMQQLMTHNMLILTDECKITTINYALTVYKLALHLSWQTVPHLMAMQLLPAKSFVELVEPYAIAPATLDKHSSEVTKRIVYGNLKDLLLAISRRDDREEYVTALVRKDYIGLAVNLLLFFSSNKEVKVFYKEHCNGKGLDKITPYIKMIPKETRLSALKRFGKFWLYTNSNYYDGFEDLFDSQLDKVVATIEKYRTEMRFQNLCCVLLQWARDHLAKALEVVAHLVRASEAKLSEGLLEYYNVDSTGPSPRLRRKVDCNKKEMKTVLGFVIANWRDSQTCQIQNALQSLEFTYHFKGKRLYDDVANELIKLNHMPVVRLAIVNFYTDPWRPKLQRSQSSEL